MDWREKLRKVLYALEQAEDRARGEVRVPMFGGKLSFESRLFAKVFRADGTIEDLGLIATKLVTVVFVNYLVDSMQDSTTTPMDVFKYHDSGTGTTAAQNTDTDLQTKVETGRATGTTVEGASANIFRSVGTITYTASRAITEHGVFSAASAGTMADRHVFAVVNVGNGESIQFTYELTATAET